MSRRVATLPEKQRQAFVAELQARMEAAEHAVDRMQLAEPLVRERYRDRALEASLAGTSFVIEELHEDARKDVSRPGYCGPCQKQVEDIREHDHAGEAAVADPQVVEAAIREYEAHRPPAQPPPTALPTALPTLPAAPRARAPMMEAGEQQALADAATPPFAPKTGSLARAIAAVHDTIHAPGEPCTCPESANPAVAAVERQRQEAARTAPAPVARSSPAVHVPRLAPGQQGRRVRAVAVPRAWEPWMRNLGFEQLPKITEEGLAWELVTTDEHATKVMRDLAERRVQYKQDAVEGA